MKTPIYILITLLGFISYSVQAGSEKVLSQAEVVQQLLAKYASDAREEAKEAGEKNPKPVAFSAEAGRAFFLKRRTFSTSDLSCSSCHTDNPVNEGKNIQTKMRIPPLAISANPNRFTDVLKVEKNFSKHCYDLWGKDCSAQDKGDFITYLKSAK